MQTRGAVTVFSDFTCPFSYVTEAALRRRAAAADREILYRAFELYPRPAPLPAPAEEPGWEALVRPLAEPLGLPLRAPAFRPRTTKAHEAFRFAAEQGRGPELRDALFRAYWGEGRDIGRIDVLQELAAGVGLEPTDLKIALDLDRFADHVAHDREVAAQLHIRAVPVLFVGTGPGARILVGAQAPAALDEALAEQ